MKVTFIIVVVLLLLLNTGYSQVDISDSNALVSFFDQTNGATWKTRTGWKTTTPVKDWYGVSVDPVTNRVVKIILANNNLSGALTNVIAPMIALRILRLEHNSISGKLPDQLDNLVVLDSLELSNNLFNGKIPTAFGGLSVLRHMDLSYNYLTFDGLQSLNRYGNQLTFFPQNNLHIIRKNLSQIAVSSGSNSVENTYMWYKNGILTTVRPGDSTIYITDSSSYFVKVTNINFADTLISEIYIPTADWAFVGIDSTTLPSIKQSWSINSIAFHHAGLEQGVYAGGTLRNSGGENVLGYWDGVSQDWSLVSSPAQTAIINKIVSASSFGGLGLYVVGRHIDPPSPTFWGGYIANRFGDGWNFMPGTDWTEPDPDYYDFSGLHIDIASTGNTFYAAATIKDPINDFDFAEYDNSSWKPLYLNAWGTNSIDTLDILVTAALNQSITDPDDYQTWNVIPQRMAVDFAGDVFIAGLAINITTTQQNKIFAARWDRGSGKWALKGIFMDYAHSFDKTSTYEQVVRNGVFAVATPEDGSGEMLIGGNFTDASGNYYLARHNSISNQFEPYANWSFTNEPLRFNGPVQSIIRGGSDWFVAGDFTNSANLTYVVKIDGLDNADTLGHGPLKTSSIKSLAYGRRNNLDVYASGLFQDEAERTYFLAHYSPTNCATVKINVASEDVFTIKKYTFTAQTFNTGPYPLYVWRKNNSTILGNYSNSLVLTSKQLRDGDSIFCTVIGYSDCSIAPITDTFAYKNLILGPLPVQLISFNAHLSADHIKTTWETAFEQNVSHFTVLSSKDGFHFSAIGKVAAKNVGSSTYEFIDPDRSMAHQSVPVYYELEQVDLDGTTTNSKIVTVMPKNRQIALTINPNPVSGILFIHFSPLTNKGSMQILDDVGRLMANWDLVPGKQDLEIDFSKYPKGVYFISLRVHDHTEVRRVVKSN